jgi:hypothetical protein
MKKYFDIGLTGLAGSGKNTVADLIARYFPLYVEVSFANTLKYTCMHHFNWDGQKDSKGRKLLQTIGMAVRDYDPDAWIKITEKEINADRKNHSFIYTDVRFNNEADYIRNNRGVIIRVVRPSLELTKTHEHISEKAQSEIEVDYVIVNDGTLDDLKEKVFNMIKELSNDTIKPYKLCPSPLI